METSTMIRQLRRTAKKHENDKLLTFATDITAMCTDVANRLEELEKKNKEIRAKAIDEFAERLKSESYNGYATLEDYCEDTIESVAVEDIVRIAEQLKAGGKNENI